jgi:hypothetical protein
MLYKITITLTKVSLSVVFGSILGWLAFQFLP